MDFSYIVLDHRSIVQNLTRSNPKYYYIILPRMLNAE